MKYILLQYDYRIDYLINALINSKEHDVVAIITDETYYNSLKQDQRCIDNCIEIVNTVDEVTNDFDSMINVTGLPQNHVIGIIPDRFIDKKIVTIPYKDSSSLLSCDFKKFDIPIITVTKMNPRVKTLDFLLKISQKISDDGYKVSVLSDEKMITLFGYHTYDVSLFSSDPINVKIEDLNEYIKSIVEIEKTEVLIVDIPGSIYDEFQLVVQHAISSDYNIVLTEAFGCFESSYSLVKKTIKEYVLEKLI